MESLSRNEDRLYCNTGASGTQPLLHCSIVFLFYGLTLRIHTCKEWSFLTSLLDGILLFGSLVLRFDPTIICNLAAA